MDIWNKLIIIKLDLFIKLLKMIACPLEKSLGELCEPLNQCCK